ncbi:hypothetical protein BKA62DRAFT_764073 [Auriculariales sp. MPI-PUGE-AT-0066]|nr:hypothetical protein BKA62DRAFT_764073 [Auriculariales sp. MPI-PUGE-AT-0066]
MGKPGEAKTSNGISRTSAAAQSQAAQFGAVWWVTAWFLLSAPIVFWDSTYCFMRPRSMRGGDLHWIWKPYALYQEIDLVYGEKALQENSGFTSAQAFMSIVETVLNLFYVYKVHVSPSSTAPLIGLCSATMALSKTMLYWASEYFCNYCAVGHNTMFNLVFLWMIPTGMWLVMPALIIVRLGGEVARQLQVAALTPLSRRV